MKETRDFNFLLPPCLPIEPLGGLEVFFILKIFFVKFEKFRPKHPHAQYIGDRPVRTIVSKSAARANITDRLEELARPKEHSNDHYFIDSRKPEESITKVKKGKRLASI